jgi:chemotaxis protein methyltransferase CheR
MGLQFEDARLDALADVLRERMEALACNNFDSYLARLSAGGREEVRWLAGRLTVGETYFFRYWDHFRAFSEVVLADWAGGSGARRPLRILSAGCASGEEAYSLAILIRERLPTADPFGVTILGVDVNPIALEKAARARYSAWSLRDTSDELRSRYFRAEGREFQLDESIRAMVSFEERNLVDEGDSLLREDRFDVVFCRNVMMYFSPDVMATTVTRIGHTLSAGGFLFLGHAETLRGLSDGFHLRHTHDTFYYQRRDGASAERVPVAPWTPSVAHKGPLGSSLGLVDTSWISSIQRAGDRIAQLTRAPPPPSASQRPSPPWSPNETPPPPARVHSHTDLGPALELLRQERFADAMEVLPAIPNHARLDLDAELLRAVLLMNRGMLPDAERICAQILGADELNSGAHYLMALCREHAGDRATAIEHDKTAAYLDPSFAMPHLHVGLLARRGGDLERARTELGRALFLLTKEDPARILLFGGGFSRDALVDICRSELKVAGVSS